MEKENSNKEWKFDLTKAAPKSTEVSLKEPLGYTNNTNNVVVKVSTNSKAGNYTFVEALEAKAWALAKSHKKVNTRKSCRPQDCQVCNCTVSERMSAALRNSRAVVSAVARSLQRCLRPSRRWHPSNCNCIDGNQQTRARCWEFRDHSALRAHRRSGHIGYAPEPIGGPTP